MKKALTVLAILLFPLSIWAMMPITDSQLSDVTGQAGISLNVDITLDMSFGELGWGDSDGLPDSGLPGGWIGLDQFSISTLHIWPRTDYTMDNTTGIGNWNDLQFLTIDVVTLPATSLHNPFGTNVSGVTAVRIGVPTLTVTMDALAGNVVLGPRGGVVSTIGGMVDDLYTTDAKIVDGPAFDQLMGKFYIGGLNMATGTGGAVLIFAHGGSSVSGHNGQNLYGSGITINLSNVNVDYLLLDTAAWGDIEGVAASSTIDTAQATYGLMGPGWIGLKDLAVKDIVINGTIAIDVATVLPAGGNPLDTVSSVDSINLDYTDLVGALNDIYNAVGGHGSSFVSIGFVDGFNVGVGEMGAKVQLGPTNALGQEMGDIHLSGATLVINDNPVTGTKSFIHIFAH